MAKSKSKSATRILAEGLEEHKGRTALAGLRIVAVEAEPAEVYVVVNPLTYGDPEVRHEAGAEVSDIPAESITWLLEQGHIRVKGGN